MTSEDESPAVKWAREEGRLFGALAANDSAILEPAREDTLANGAIRKRWRPDQLDAFSPAEVWEIGALC